MNTQTNLSRPPTRVPRVDVWGADEGWRLLAELPGANPETVNVTAERGTLTVFAEAADATFKRSFRLPDDVDTDAIVARLDKGLLTLNLPRVPTARSRQIRVESA
jgi:HSP20 family protein